MARWTIANRFQCENVQPVWLWKCRVNARLDIPTLEAASSIETLMLGASRNVNAHSSSRTEDGSRSFKVSILVWQTSNWINSRRMSAMWC
jgi:hypothetical protein